jgi:transketolase
MLKPAVDAADTLQGEGLSVRVLSMPTLKPLDVDAVLAAARETGAIITTEEHSITGGLGSAVAEVLAESGVAIQFRRHGVPDRRYHVIGSQTYMRETVMGNLAELIRGSLNAV